MCRLSSVPIASWLTVWGGLLSVVGQWSCASQEPATVTRRTPETELPQPAIATERVDDAIKQKQLDDLVKQKALESPNGLGSTSSEKAVVQGSSSSPVDTKAQQSGTGTGTNQSSKNVVVVINYDGFFYPQKMKECQEAGKIYDRATLECHTSQTVASSSSGFSCSENGIVTAFGNSDVVSKQLDSKILSNWKIDQCGFEANQKKVVWLVCFTDKTQSCSAQPVCKDQKDLDPKETKFCMSKISET